MKKSILLALMLNSFFALADFKFINSQQTAGKGGKSVFGKSEDGDIFIFYNDNKISLTKCSKKYNFKLNNYTILQEYIIVDNRKILITDCINKNFLTKLSK